MKNIIVRTRVGLLARGSLPLCVAFPAGLDPTSGFGDARANRLQLRGQPRPWLVIQPHRVPVSSRRRFHAIRNPYPNTREFYPEVGWGRQANFELTSPMYAINYEVADVRKAGRGKGSDYPLSTPPVALFTWAMILAATASISSSVMVRSVGCI